MAVLPAASILGQRHRRALPNLPVRLHHPVEEHFTCAGCGGVLVEGSPAVPARPLAYALLLCECGQYNQLPQGGHLRREVA